MYIWTAIDVNDQLSALRQKDELITKELSITNHAITLPLHVSLRMSFYIDDLYFEKAVCTIEQYLKTLQAFDIRTKEIEHCDDIIWCSMEPNQNLTEIHSHLVAMMEEDFSVKPHPFDLSFFYHSTLFMGESSPKMNDAFTRIKGTFVPDILHANHFVIGSSVSGKAGEFAVIKDIYV